MRASLLDNLARAIGWRFSLAVLGKTWLILLVIATTAFAQRWPDEYQDGPFSYHADFRMQSLHPLLKSVSQLRMDVPEKLGLGEVKEQIHVFLFRRDATYKGYVGKYFPTVPSRPALFVKQRGPGMVFARLSPEIAVDLRHETTHAVLHGILPMVPLWLDEGLGEYFEVPADWRETRNPHFASVRSKLVRWRRVPSIEQLEGLSDLSQMHAEHYRNAWSWVHFMLHGPPEAKRALQDFLQQIEAHVPPGELSKILRRSIPQLEREYLAHFKKYRTR